MRYFQRSDRIFRTRADVIVFALYLILADSARQSTLRHFSLQKKIQINNHLRTPFWGTYENFRPGSQTAGGGAPYAPHCTYQITGLPSMQITICLRGSRLRAVPADARTGAGKAIVSNYHAQDFDYTLALKAQDCKRTIARRAPSSRRCNFSLFLMREHIKS